jgi:hypothetical protein
MLSAADWESHRPAVFGAAYRILGSVAEAEDVTQEVWLRAAPADSSELRDLRAWLVTVAVRCGDEPPGLRRHPRRLRLPQPVRRSRHPARSAQLLTLHVSKTPTLTALLAGLGRAGQGRPIEIPLPGLTGVLWDRIGKRGMIRASPGLRRSGPRRTRDGCLGVVADPPPQLDRARGHRARPEGTWPR